MVARGLQAAGHDAVHVRHYGLAAASDADIAARAEGEGRIVLSADTDFGALLALRRVSEPSVILLRRGPRRPLEQVAPILANPADIEEPLRSGAVVSLDKDRMRIRRMPVGRRC